MPTKIGIVSLGCDKNRVDTEYMMSILTNGAHSLVSDLSAAEVIIVNTCAFIESARVEAIDTILSMAEYKKSNCKYLIVTGCLPQKYLSELEELTEVDAFLGVGCYDKINEIIVKLDSSKQFKCTDILDSDKTNRIISSPAHYAYLKIAEGCNNCCSYCLIPSIRGKYRSRPLANIVAEAKKLVDSGVRELILVAQDLTNYGSDLTEQVSLVSLIRELSALDVMWIRLMYCYPEKVTGELITEIISNPKVAKYIDVPLQHICDTVLERMNRQSSTAQIKKLIDKLSRATCHISIRTTLMVGFPGESQEEFEELKQFVSTSRIDHIGIFAYSHEADAPSSKMSDTVSIEDKLERVNILGKIHREQTKQRNKKLIGSVLDVIYEDIDYDRQMFVGRTQYNAPGVDSVVYFSGSFADVGKMYRVKITGVDKYDLIGVIEK